MTDEKLEKTQEEKAVFCMTTGGDGLPFTAIGLSDAAMDHMKEGMSHSFDLTKLGVPLKLMLFGGGTRTEIEKQIHGWNEQLGKETIKSDEDFGL